MERRIENLTRAQLIVLTVFTGAGQFSISITQICGFLSCAIWLYKTHVTRSWNHLRWPLWIPFAGFSIACILAVITALDPPRSFEHLKRLLEMGIFFMILNSLSDPGLKQSLHSMFNQLKQTRPGQLLFGQQATAAAPSPRDYLIGLIILSASISAVIGIIQVAIHGLSIHHRISGTLSIYMTFAGLLMQAVLVAAAYLLFRNGKNKWVWIALLLMLSALALTLTRQAWLGFGVGLLILLAFRKPAWVTLLPVFATLVFWLSPAPIKERMESIANLGDITFQQRLSMWRLGWNIYRDYPVSGCGFHCLMKVRTDYPEHKEITRAYRTLHNNIVQLAVDTGTIGVLAWLSLWLSFLARVYFMALGRVSHSGNDPPDRWVALASLSAVTAFLTGGLFETNSYDSEVIMLTYFLMALPFVYNDSRAPNATLSKLERS
ncbi:MAG: O-antigen ligase family protein [Nitrospinota bacterium]|nr:O-antigen ligase family protein [Nitrospinota bacterium]